MSRKISAALAFLLALLLAAVFASCDRLPGIINGSSSPESAADPSPAVSSDVSSPETQKLLKVRFFDVGQGDSVFIEFPDGSNMLIDCGERDYAGRVISFIDCLGCKRIDRLVVSHPHTDHMGGMSFVVSNFDIGEIYMPACTSNNSTFTALLEAISAKNMTAKEATAGVKLDVPGCKVEFLGPVSIDPESLNNCSAVIRLEYGSTSFLFTADAEYAEEAEILAKYPDSLKSDVLKVGHHGSGTSSSEEFLLAVGADIGVISCGKDNPYGHPHDNLLKRLARGGVGYIYRTDVSGTVTVTSDGSALQVEEGDPVLDYKWVLNIAGKKIHTPDCDGAASMKDYNRAFSVRSLADLEALGYTRCNTCKPEE